MSRNVRDAGSVLSEKLERVLLDAYAKHGLFDIRALAERAGWMAAVQGWQPPAELPSMPMRKRVSPTPRGKPAAKTKSRQQRYDAFVAAILVTADRVSRVEDRAWAKTQGLTQTVVEGLRENNPEPRLHKRGQPRSSRS